RAQPVVINSVDHRAFLGTLCFPLDDGCKRHDIVSVESKRRESIVPFRFPLALESLDHLAHRLSRSSSLRKRVSIGKEIALEIFCRDVESVELCRIAYRRVHGLNRNVKSLREQRNYLLQRISFGNRD